MSYSTPSLSNRRKANFVDDIHDLICVIETIKQQLSDNGFDSAAESLRTTITDLRWQVEQLLVENS